MGLHFFAVFYRHVNSFFKWLNHIKCITFNLCDFSNDRMRLYWILLPLETRKIIIQSGNSDHIMQLQATEVALLTNRYI